MTGEEIVTQVARCLWEQKSEAFPPNVQAMKDPWRILVGDARTVVLATLDAIREPSSTVWNTSVLHMDSGSSNGAWWRAMIDALRREVAG